MALDGVGPTVWFTVHVGHQLRCQDADEGRAQGRAAGIG